MGELFERTVVEVPLAWTGERLTTDASPQVEIEHLHRYFLARTLCRGLDVLDVASGEGYGTALLAQTARSVIGVELNAEAIAHASKNYTAPNLRFAHGDARNMALPDACVDIVISFETIEHFYEHDAFLAEVRRVLRPGGRLVISSPERDVYSPAGGDFNPHHVRELTRAEFLALLRSYFVNVSLHGQRPMIGSALIAEALSTSGERPAPLTYERRGSNRYEESQGLSRPVYLVAVASDVSVSDIPDSLYVDSSSIEDALVSLPVAREEGRQSAAALVEAGAYARHLEAEFADRCQQLEQAESRTSKLEAELVQAGSYARRLETEFADRGAQLKQAESRAHELETEFAPRDAQLEQTASRVRELEIESALRNAQLEQTESRVRELEAALVRAQHVTSHLAPRVEALTNALAETEAVLIEARRVGQKIQAEHVVTIAALDEARLSVVAKNSELADATKYARHVEEHLSHASVAREAGAAYARRLEVELAASQANYEALQANLAALVGSSAWKATGPFRSSMERYPRARRYLRRVAKLIWWAATLQLPGRIITRLNGDRQGGLAESDAPVSGLGYAPSENSEAGNDDQASALEPVPSVSPPPIAESVSVLSIDKKARFRAQAHCELLAFLASGERLVFRAPESPDVSVILVLWNQAHLTLRCLQALRAQHGPSLEVVIFDNASQDETGNLLSRVDGATMLRSTTNDGFLLGCNKAIIAACGRAVLLLNNDAFVHPSAIATALDVLDTNDRVGAVGARLILPSGELQEAGSIMWSDASSLGYGRGLSPQVGEAMFRRNVDYCSGAFLMTPRRLWDQLGGFDEAFAPAYYEEADYCMRLRSLGYSVVYEPRVVVDHYEFGSEEREGDAAAASRRNRKLFRARHSNALRRQHLPPAAINVLTARESVETNRRRLLVIDNELPLTALGSGYPRMRQLLIEATSLGWFVTFFPLHRPDVDWEAARRELPGTIEIAADRGSPALATFLEERQGYYEVVLVSRPDNMALFTAALGDRPHLLDGCRVIYDAEALFCTRDVIRARVEGRLVPEIEPLISAEVGLAAGADAILCVTQSEAAIYRSRSLGAVYTLSHPTEIAADVPEWTARSGFLFVGRLLERDAPNWRGLAWFISECWPRIRVRLPGATLRVAGHLHSDHDELEAPGVELCGPIDDLRPLYDAARVFVAPIRFAAGIPIKVLEATAAGLPTAGARLMAQQLGWTAGVEMVAEDDPGTLASATVALHKDVELWHRHRDAAIQRLHQEHSASAFRAALQDILSGTLPATSAGPHEKPGDADEQYRIERVNEVWAGQNPVWCGEAKQWMAHPMVAERINMLASGDPHVDAYGHLKAVLTRLGWTLPVARAASLCCGEGSLERELVKQGYAQSVVGYDLAQKAIEVARHSAQAEGLRGLEYEVRDLELNGLSTTGLDLVFSFSGVHHLSRLEKTFNAVHEALRPGGVFHVYEYVGPDRFQWTERQLLEINDFLERLPNRYRRLPDGSLKPLVTRPTIQEMLDADPSEAVRSSRIEPLLKERFRILDRREIGGTLLHMGLSNIAQNFDPMIEEDRYWVTQLFEREDALLNENALTSDFAIYVAQRS